MQVFSGFSECVPDLPTAVTIGSFDGVHLGHQRLINSVVHSARPQGYSSVLVTFSPHPRSVTEHVNVRCITTNQEKLAYFKQLGLDIVVIARFTHEFQKTSANDFVSLLVNHLGMKELWVGYDFIFGNQREGTKSILKLLSLQYGFRLHRISPVMVDNRPVSSRRIREALAAGDISQANKCLGHRSAQLSPTVFFQPSEEVADLYL